MTKSDPTAAEAAAEALIFVDAALASTTTSDALAQYRFVIERLAPRGYGTALAAAHGRALAAGNDALAALLRSVTAIEDVAAAAESLAETFDGTPISVARAAAADVAVGTFKLRCAEQLTAAAGPLAKPARAYLDARAARERAEAEQAAQAEQARIEADLAEAEQAAQEQAEREERERAEAERELADALRHVGIAAEDERRRVTAAVELRRRLRTTRAAVVRIGHARYAPTELAFAVGQLGPEQLASFTAALDRAEAEVEGNAA